jgi:2-amino-4-hydroxy-6-hydroxymethyldihydropteridine diphosphokinase
MLLTKLKINQRFNFVKYKNIILSFGSNIGDKIENIKKAYLLLESNQKINIIQRSDFYKSSPIGYMEQDWFVNTAVDIETDYEPEELLKELKRIEEEMGRKKTFKWGPRIIDIDIIFWNDLSLNSRSLNIPHINALQRKFVLVTVLDIDTKYKDPIENKPLKDYLKNLKSSEILEKIANK